MDKKAVGIFDSGFGGVSVLKEASGLLPDEDFIYYGDHANLPYGDKTPEQVKELSAAAAEKLAGYGVKALVVACNTATSAAIKDIRARFNMPVISMEPAVRPACRYAPKGSILVLATNGTIAQPRYRELVAREDAQERVISVACPGLADKIEWLADDAARFDMARELLGEYLADFHGTKVGAIVLGCTHYIFLKKHLEAYVKKYFDGALVFDGNEGTARQLKRVLEENGLRRSGGSGCITFHTSGDEEALRKRFYTLLNL